MMAKAIRVRRLSIVGVAIGAALAFLAIANARQSAAQTPNQATLAARYSGAIQPHIKKYCLGCHSTKAKKGSLDLERFHTLDDIRKDLKAWLGVIEQLVAGEMPPKEKPQPTAAEKKQLIGWISDFLEAEARAHSGDPGHVPLRRLSNAEYDYTIRDLTGVDLQPTREFPADGAAGEGFTNAAEALTDISPVLFSKYLNAAKDIADHAVLLPDGFRFSPSKTRRDWTDESTAQLRKYYADYATGDGRLAFQPYLAATVRHRAAISSGAITLNETAAQEKLNPKYLAELWRTLTDHSPSYPLDRIRARWRQATPNEVPALADEVAAWQAVLWKTVRVGSYIQPVGKGYADSPSRQVANDPAVVDAVPLRVAVKPAPGQSDIVLYLAAREATNPGGQVVWHRPRLESAGKEPLLLRDYAQFGPAYEVDYPSIFANSSKYLAAAIEAANNRRASVEDIATRHGLEAVFLRRWIEVLAVRPLRNKLDGPDMKPAAPIVLLDEKAAMIENRPAINGWRRRGTDLPFVFTNSSDTVQYFPGKSSPHGVMVHPTPKEFVAVAWNSPIAGIVRVNFRITHAHPACGNGVAWWLEQRRAGRAIVLAEGALPLGGEVKPAAKLLKIDQGDLIVLAVDPKNGDHACDSTEAALTVTEDAKPNRVWDLSADVAATILAGNPHNDRHGHSDVWSFVRGPSKPTGPAALIPPDSLLAQWREAAADLGRQTEAARIAAQVQTLLAGPRPAQEKDPNRVLYDRLVTIDSPLFQGLEPARVAKSRAKASPFGLPRERFGKHPAGTPTQDADFVAAANTVTEVRLPAALFRDRTFVVEGRLDSASDNRVVEFRVHTNRPGPDDRWDGKSQVAAAPGGAGYQQLLSGYADFRRLFPQFICFPPVIPTDEVVSLKMFHREDEPLVRLFLDDAQARRLDRLWNVHRFVSRQPVLENAHLPQFIGYVTQDQPKEMVTAFESRRPAFQKRADDFENDEKAAIPKQLQALLDFAERAFRRPLEVKEKADLLALYPTIIAKGAGRDEAFRGLLVRVLVSPAFLYRFEQAPAAAAAGAVNDWELATRLSYFLWSSVPDEQLRRLAGAGQLRESKILADQTRRMLRDSRVRSLAIEFGTQWIHVRGFDELKEKNEKLFPTFDPNLRRAIYEESILFFQDLFQSDRAVTNILDADYAFLNEALAKHYGIPGVAGPEWRLVADVRKYGRGGVLGLASVLAKEAGASRTSPVLRGNWVVETLLGEKLPRPPANVPRLPEEEGSAGLTVRQQVEKHARIAECAVCHQRIDPFGFALEQYDPIGRWRDKDLGGLSVDAKTKLKDGTEFAGIDGLRDYLLTKKKEVIVRLFCRRLLGYALGRAVTLSDQLLIDEMVSELNRNNGRVVAAVLAIVKSPQFRMIRGSAFANHE